MQLPADLLIWVMMPANRKVIVVVEDEWLIRTSADQIKSHGFEILEAESADEALELLHLHHWAVAVLFTDVHMPGDMNGLQLAHHVSAHWPWIAI